MDKPLLSLYNNIKNDIKCINLVRRFYRTKHRKKVSIELNKPSLYDPKRTAPSKLLKANLFTPESAGPRELSMLCFWIVNYGYADYCILSRYVQCAIDNIKKLKIKSLALIFHSTSKFIYNNTISFIEASQQNSQSNESNSEPKIEFDEYVEREQLIRKCMKLIIEASPILPNLFINAVPKDLGMISLSIINIYESFLNECDTNTESATVNLDLKSITLKINKLLHRLSEEIIPKLPFCEIDEFAAFAKSFSKINTDWSRHFMRELSLEISSLLMEKIEDLELLKQNKYIGEDLIEELNKFPKELSTVTCALSRLKINEKRFWERSETLISLMIELMDKDFGIKEIDITTLTLLCTSMCNYTNVTPVVMELLRVCDKSHQPSILVGFNTCVRFLKDDSLSSKFLELVDMDHVMELDSKLVSQFILNCCKSTCDCTKIIDKISSFPPDQLDNELLSTVYICNKQLKISPETKIDLCNRLFENADSLQTNLLVTILLTSIHSIDEECVKNLCKKVLDVLYNRSEELPDSVIPSLLSLVLDHFPGNLDIIKRFCKKIDNSDFNIEELSHIFTQIQSMGLNINKLFTKNFTKIKEINDVQHDYSFDPEQSDSYDNSLELSTNNESFDIKFTECGQDDFDIKFTECDQDEIMKISKQTLQKPESVPFLNLDDFKDLRTPNNTPQFNVTKFPTNYDNTTYTPDSSDKVVFRGLPNANTVDELKTQWSNFRHNTH
ncbi:hypothetical protein TpMuguga_01g01001 [Theileria parva strain Muguga]|uniref:Uncharacterized protein n=1 Tax=Theileria parva TaxID=5875 RepID=Q4N719_THEPA|nr:uncharacterized protein TpMuguga_01g01001 [Theileria parva strain Muguga]EAN34239.1 hypothetical protein TpMuguga_01g01001 [Theileria parva strain Muguga]|eukprot:XP_766522.1 hypothetical protein [Theileria parva strain Muguga]